MGLIAFIVHDPPDTMWAPYGMFVWDTTELQDIAGNCVDKIS